jgi:isocitrate lyase
VGAGYFDSVTQAIASGMSSITALMGSTEEQQFGAEEPEREVRSA